MFANPKPEILVTGATSTIGSILIPMLDECSESVLALGRTPYSGSKLTKWHFLDLADLAVPLPHVQGNILIHTASLWLLHGWLDKFYNCGVRRIIAFSSTSRFTKQTSTNARELDVVNKLIIAEDQVIAECERLGMVWTIFRPTLIYGGRGGDRNIADIAMLIRRFGFFPLLRSANGRRQPVNAHDLAKACVQSLHVPASYNKSYNLSGGEILTYAEMVKRVFKTLKRSPVLIPVPISVFRMVVFVARIHPRFAHLTADMALRMQTDLVFDHSDAMRDFGYQPRKFDPDYLSTLFL